jgi:tetratricopeptide (TPR) repeat protein
VVLCYAQRIRKHKLKLLLTLLLPVANAFGAGGAPEVPECFKVHSLIRMDEEHYWANWTNACPYTIDSVYVMVKFWSESGGTLGDGVWGLHFVTPGTHQVTRFTSPLSLPDFHSVHVAKITTDSAEALHADPVRQPPPLIVAAKVVTAAKAESPSLSADEHHRRGRDLLEKRNYREAVTEVSEAIRERTDFALAYNARGFAYYMLRDYRQANADLDEAIRLNPKYLNAFQNRSHARKAAGDLKGSLADANQARALTARPR